jgi:hypothetical protein
MLKGVQIESAHVAQMDWTLANKTADKKKAKSWVYEAEVANAEVGAVLSCLCKY